MGSCDFVKLETKPNQGRVMLIARKDTGQTKQML
jgi:hypothetical protein